jgi:hypothetical protein
MSDTDLARTMNYHRGMATKETRAGQNYRAEARRAADAGDTKYARLLDCHASDCERRSQLWAQLADEVQGYLQERAVADPRLL